MSRKIVLTDNQIKEIIDFAVQTYQCTTKDISNHFNISYNTIVNNIPKETLDKIIFHGIKDSTKEKIRKTLTGRVQSEETKEKRRNSMKIFFANQTKEQKEKANIKRQQTLIEKYGSVQNSYAQRSETSKKTKLERYGDENYNNLEKGKKTKLEKYGDKNYNNKERIRKTQFEKYGCYAFNDWEKVRATNLERYGVEHNWSSPEHDGHEKRYGMYGGKEEYYKHVMEKGKATRLALYADEFYSNSEKAQQTMLERYGVTSYMYTEDFINKKTSPETRQKAIDTKRKNNTFHVSEPEKIVKNILVEAFGENDVFTEYQDERYASKETGYKFKCDFYIKSKDLFIELNLHPTHLLHPFCIDNKEDCIMLNKLQENDTTWNRVCIDV